MNGSVSPTISAENVSPISTIVISGFEVTGKVENKENVKLNFIASKATSVVSFKSLLGSNFVVDSNNKGIEFSGSKIDDTIPCSVSDR